MRILLPGVSETPEWLKSDPIDSTATITLVKTITRGFMGAGNFLRFFLFRHGGAGLTTLLNG
jgi:hypothetical protein